MNKKNTILIVGLGCIATVYLLITNFQNKQDGGGQTKTKTTAAIPVVVGLQNDQIEPHSTPNFHKKSLPPDLQGEVDNFENKFNELSQLSNQTKFIHEAIHLIGRMAELKAGDKVLEWYRRIGGSMELPELVRSAIGGCAGASNNLTDQELKQWCQSKIFGISFVGMLAELHPESLSRLDLLKDNPNYNRFLCSAGTSLASAGRWEQALELAKSIPVPKYQTEVEASAVNEWAQKSPDEAAAWVGAVPESAGEKKGDLAISLVTGWYQIDSEATSKWVKALAPGRTKDLATGALIAVLVGIETDAAEAWAQTIQDGTLRREAMAIVKRGQDR